MQSQLIDVREFPPTPNWTTAFGAAMREAERTGRSVGLGGETYQIDGTVELPRFRQSDEANQGLTAPARVWAIDGQGATIIHSGDGPVFRHVCDDAADQALAIKSVQPAFRDMSFVGSTTNNNPQPNECAILYEGAYNPEFSNITVERMRGPDLKFAINPRIEGLKHWHGGAAGSLVRIGPSPHDGANSTKPILVGCRSYTRAQVIAYDIVASGAILLGCVAEGWEAKTAFRVPHGTVMFGGHAEVTDLGTAIRLELGQHGSATITEFAFNGNGDYVWIDASGNNSGTVRVINPHVTFAPERVRWKCGQAASMQHWTIEGLRDPKLLKSAAWQDGDQPWLTASGTGPANMGPWAMGRGEVKQVDSEGNVINE